MARWKSTSLAKTRDESVDHRLRQALFQRGLVEALVEAHAARIRRRRRLRSARLRRRVRRHRRIGAVVVDGDGRLELIVGIDRDPGDPRSRAADGRLLGQQDDLLPFADGRLAVLDAEGRR